jgi:hypothetical protein
MLFASSFKREDRRIFYIQLRWGRLWKTTIDRRKGVASTYPHRSLPASINLSLLNVRRLNNDYIRRFEDRYMAQYKMRRIASAADWELVDRKDSYDVP